MNQAIEVEEKTDSEKMPSTRRLPTLSRDGAATPSSSTSSTAAAASNTAVSSDLRYSQLLDEADHERCSTGNQQTLLEVKLERLRDLEKEIQQDDWKFQKPMLKLGASGTKMFVDPKP